MVALWLTRRPSPFELEGEFVKAWNRSDVAALAALSDEDHRQGFESFLRRLPANRGWKDGFPALPKPELHWGEDSVRATYAIDGGPVEAWWELRRSRWWLRAITLPRRTEEVDARTR